MSDKKHIDRLFQEKFKDFEAKPNPDIWDNIQKELDQPEQKTIAIIPIWLRYAGVAAILLLFFTLGNSIFNNSEAETPVVNTENTTQSNDKNSEQVVTDDASTLSNIKNSGLTNSENNENTETLNLYDEVSTGNENTVVTDNVSTSKNIKTEESKSGINTSVNNTASSNALKNKNAQLNKRYVSTNSTKNNLYTSENSTISNKKDTSKGNKPTKNVTAIKKTINSDNNSLVTKTDINKINDNSIESKNINKAISNIDLALKTESEKEGKLAQKDSTKTSESIEEAIAKTEEEIIEKEKDVNRWTVNANVAPVYYNTLGKGSSIHEQFIDNPKNGEINTSYGVMVGYAFNDRLKLRSGVSKLNLSYDTANVIVYENVSTSSSSSSNLKNIDFAQNSQGQTISVLSASNLGVQQISSVLNDSYNAALSQRISYVEVPLEMEYALVNKRFGVNVIGGVSTFILNDNKVVSEFEGRKTQIGEANNINSISFSTNFGLGIDYKFTESFKFNLEPTFKYQMNAFSDTSGDFKPYIIGVYTGFSYKF